MGSPLDSTYGFWLVISWLQSLRCSLQGCGLLQAWLYFHWYSKDHWALKTMVVTLTVVELFQIILYFQATYLYLIDGFGNLPGLRLIHWEDSAQLLATYTSTFIVQMYFGFCIYILDKKNKIIPAIIALLAFLQIAFGLVQSVLVFKLKSFDQLDGTKAFTTVEAASALLCDIVITASLIQNLGKHKGGLKTTNSLLNNLMIYAVNRGVLTATCAALNLILFLALPGTFYFFIGIELSGKLYMNSALATLNSRQHVITNAYAKNSADWSSIQMAPLSNDANGSAAVGNNHHVRIQVNKQVEFHEDSKKPDFMDGMI